MAKAKAKAKGTAPAATPSSTAKVFYIEKSSTSRVYIQVKEYKGSERVDVREFFLRGRSSNDEKTPAGCFDDKAGGIWQFTGKGISLNAEMLDEFVEKVTELAS